MKQKIICIVGPTASGKTSLAIALAKQWNAEIISADSMQIYQELAIGTAKATCEEQAQIKHHLIDICQLSDQFSVADYQKKCFETMDEIISRGKNVIIAGGTGLYISAVVKEMQFEEQIIDENYRNELYQLANEYSKEYVWNILNELDPNTAKQIHPNNLKRVVRAIEIAKYATKLKSEHMQEEKIRLQKNESKYDFYVFHIEFERDKLYNRINERVNQMIEQGLLQEAKMVFDKRLPKENTCMQAIGYKEFFSYFENQSNLEQCIEKLKQETRNYAKRQITWFKNKLETYSLNGSISQQELIDQMLRTIQA